MARLHYLVVFIDGQWKILLDQQYYGPCPNRKAAITSAIDAAYRDGKSGHEALVSVRDENHKLLTEWTYGHDPYPPKG
jgi:hypothetical protein